IQSAPRVRGSRVPLGSGDPAVRLGLFEGLFRVAGVEHLQAADGPEAQRLVRALQLLAEQAQRLRGPGLRDELQQPAAQVVVRLRRELPDQLLDICVGMLAQEVERVLPHLRVGLPHALHGLIETPPRHAHTLRRPADTGTARVVPPPGLRAAVRRWCPDVFEYQGGAADYSACDALGAAMAVYGHRGGGSGTFEVSRPWGTAATRAALHGRGGPPRPWRAARGAAARRP